MKLCNYNFFVIINIQRSMCIVVVFIYVLYVLGLWQEEGLQLSLPQHLGSVVLPNVHPNSDLPHRKREWRRISLAYRTRFEFFLHILYAFMYMYVLCIFELLIPGYTSLSLSEAAAKSNKQLQYLNKTSKNILTYVSTYWWNVTCFLHSCPTYIHI